MPPSEKKEPRPCAAARPPIRVEPRADRVAVPLPRPLARVCLQQVRRPTLVPRCAARPPHTRPGTSPSRTRLRRRRRRRRALGRRAHDGVDQRRGGPRRRLGLGLGLEGYNRPFGKLSGSLDRVKLPRPCRALQGCRAATGDGPRAPAAPAAAASARALRHGRRLGRTAASRTRRRAAVSPRPPLRRRLRARLGLAMGAAFTCDAPRARAWRGRRARRSADNLYASPCANRTALPRFGALSPPPMAAEAAAPSTVGLRSCNAR